MGAKAIYKLAGTLTGTPDTLTGTLDLTALGAGRLTVTARRAREGRYRHGATGLPTFALYAGQVSASTAIGGLWHKTTGIGSNFMTGYIQTGAGKLLLSVFPSDHISGAWVVKAALDNPTTDTAPDRPF